MSEISDTSEKTKVVLIGGITGGMGTALTERLAGEDVALYGFAKNREKLDKHAEAHTHIKQTYAADALKAGEVDDVVKQVVEEEGRIDAYYHLIGSVLLKPAHQLSDEEFEDTVALNLTTAFRALRACVRPMQKAGGGSITLMSTVAAKTGLPGHEAIGAAKAGINGLVRSAAASYANRGVRVNALAPGLVDTPLSAPLVSNEKAREVSERMHPLGRIGRPGEVAAFLQWLMTDDAGWITGQILSIDGGLSTLHQRPRA